MVRSDDGHAAAATNPVLQVRFLVPRWTRHILLLMPRHSKLWVLIPALAFLSFVQPPVPLARRRQLEFGRQSKRNARGKPGLRIRLNAGPGNPTSVGAMIRLKLGDHFGAAREIQAGSGYWSQNGAVQVMGMPEPPTQIWVRWPGGKTVTADVPQRAGEIKLNANGKLKVVR